LNKDTPDGRDGIFSTIPSESGHGNFDRGSKEHGILQNPDRKPKEDAIVQKLQSPAIEAEDFNETVVTVAVPTYNESRTIEKVLVRLSNQKHSSNIKMEIIVVDDGSTDRTGEILNRMSEEHEFTHLKIKENSGKGNAVRAAIALASGTHLLIFDADSEYDTDDIQNLIRPIATKKADLVFGVRVQGVNTTHPTFVHAVGNKLMTSTANLLYGSSISDLHTCLKLVRLSLLRSLSLRETGFGLDTEITSKLLRMGHRPFEVPVSYVGRTKAEGKHIKFRDALRSFYVMAMVRLKPLPKRQYSN